MAKEPKGKNGGDAGAKDTAADTSTVQVNIVGQYVKDLSFENPNIQKLLEGGGESPNISLEVSVNAKRMPKPEFYESSIELKAQAVNNSGTIYIFECVYAGLFKVQNMAEQSVEPFLLINCPSLIFPFLRRLAADITREGGFPPLLLDPIDFAGLYVHRQQEAAKAAAQKS